MIVFAKFRTPGFWDAWRASCPDWISNWSLLPACARYPGAISGFARSAADGGRGVVEQPASAIAPPSRIPNFLIAGFSDVLPLRHRNRSALARFLLLISGEFRRTGGRSRRPARPRRAGASDGSG